MPATSNTNAATANLMGPFAEIEYGHGDMDRAIQLLSSGTGTAAQYAEWTRGRDQYRDRMTSAAAQAAVRNIKPYATPSGCVAVKMNRRFPTSLYPEQWVTLLGMKDEILAYIGDPANRDKLQFRGDDEAKKAKFEAAKAKAKAAFEARSAE